MNIETILDNNDRFNQQITFLIEIDKVKSIIRKTRNFNNKKFENDAEHGWHLCMFAIILKEYSNAEIDIVKLLKMVLIHDLVEIDSGDTLVYSINSAEKEKNEKECAERLFGLLPIDQYKEFKELWEEFEERVTPESKFAHAIDRLEPMMQNFLDEGYTWKKHNINAYQVTSVNSKIENGSETLWAFAKKIIDESIENNYLLKE